MNCAEMKIGDSLVCNDCGLELKVMKECKECNSSNNACCSGPCTFQCCDHELKLKKSAAAR